MTIIERIKKLATRAVAIHDDPNAFKNGFEAWEKVQKEMETELEAINKAVGPGLIPGRCLTFGVADGSATYIVTKVRKNDVVVEWVPLYDGYFSDAVGLSRDRTQYVINRHTAEQHSRYAEALEKLHS